MIKIFRDCVDIIKTSLFLLKRFIKLDSWWSIHWLLFADLKAWSIKVQFWLSILLLLFPDNRSRRWWNSVLWSIHVIIVSEYGFWLAKSFFSWSVHVIIYPDCVADTVKIPVQVIVSHCCFLIVRLSSIKFQFSWSIHIIVASWFCCWSR